jgi:branched-subunit amino acid ABC-type transport system permease component
VFSYDLLLNAVVAGLLLGGFYAAMALGLSIAFGQLDVVNIAHPAVIVVGSYTAYVVNDAFGMDPVLAGLVFMPAFFVVGVLIYRIYYLAFERTGEESLSGLAFFFGIMVIVEVVLIMVQDVRRPGHPRRLAGPAGAAADGRQPGQDQTVGFRHRGGDGVGRRGAASGGSISGGCSRSWSWGAWGASAAPRSRR